MTEWCGNIAMAGHGGTGEPSATPNNTNTKMELKLKYGWPFPDMRDPPLSFRLKSGMVVPMVGTFSKILLSECHQPVRGSFVVLVQLLVSYVDFFFLAGIPLYTVLPHTVSVSISIPFELLHVWIIWIVCLCWSYSEMFAVGYGI